MTVANDQCAFYCLSYKNEKRKTALANRFAELGIEVEFYDGVGFDDPRIKKPLEENYAGLRKAWSYTYGHFDMIFKFLTETEKDYGIFCEDDIRLHKSLAEDIPMLTDDFERMGLDVLLLGYLTPHRIEGHLSGFHLKQQFDNRTRKYHHYPDSLWGAQMYMLSRSHAKWLLDKYYDGYASAEAPTNPPFCSDWTITKDGVRALVFPMYAVEDGDTPYENGSQWNFHQDCFRCNFVEGEFL
jgi:GR25 family glycosyltransferase involved in LPS biosynthesis